MPVEEGRVRRIVSALRELDTAGIEAVAEKVEVESRTVWRWRAGTMKPSGKKRIARLERALDLSPWKADATPA